MNKTAIVTRGSRIFAAVKFMAIAMIALMVNSYPSLADRIDGSWCNQAGLRLVIEGSNIQLPSGKAIRGIYTRHNFSYDDPDTNATINLQQQSEDLILKFGGTGLSANGEEWRPCGAIS